MTARVALLVQDLDALGGSERQAAALAAALVPRGVEVTILTTTGPGLLDAPRHGWTEHRDGVVVFRFPLLAFEEAAGVYLAAARVDVIYAVGIMMGSIGARLARLTGAELAVKLACSGRWGDVHWLEALPPTERREVQAELARGTIVAISEDTAREAREAGFAPERMARIPNGVPAPPADPAPVRPAGDAPTVLFAGRLDRQKGADLLIEAFASVETPQAALLIAGDGPDRGALEALAAALGIEDRVRFLGRRDDVWGLMAGATAVCLPSRGEGVSNTLLEALAVGAPAVVSGIPPNAEVVGADEAAGVTFTPGDPRALARALDRVLGDADLRARLAAAGRARVAETYAMDEVADRYAALFERLARARDPHPGPLRLLARFTRAQVDQARRVARRVFPSATANGRR